MRKEIHGVAVIEWIRLSALRIQSCTVHHDTTAYQTVQRMRLRRIADLHVGFRAMNATKENRNVLRSSFFITTATVGLVYLAHDLSGSHFLPRKWLVGWYAFSGLIAINIVLFIVTLFRSMWEARSISRQDAPEEEKERLVEEIMVPALQGRIEPPEATNSLVEIVLGIAAGLLSGAVLAGAILLVLHWTRVHS